MTTEPTPSTSLRSAPRIAPGGWRDVGVMMSTIAWISGFVTGTDRPNLFVTLGRNRRLARGWLHFAGTLMPGGRLPRRETELVILRVAHRRGCDYELDHHLHLGRRAGLTARDIDAVMWDGPTVGGPDRSARETAILAMVDELLEHHDVSDGTWAAAASHLDQRALIEVVMLVGHYDMLATAITALRIQPDRRRRG